MDVATRIYIYVCMLATNLTIVRHKKFAFQILKLFIKFRCCMRCETCCKSLPPALVVVCGCVNTNDNATRQQGWQLQLTLLPVAVLRLWTKQILFAHTLSKSFAIATGYGHAPHPRGTGKEKLHVCDFYLVWVYLIHPPPLVLFAWQPVCIVVICTPEIPSSGSEHELGAQARRAAVWRHPSVLKSNSQTVELHVDIFFSVYFFALAIMISAVECCCPMWRGVCAIL